MAQPRPGYRADIDGLRAIAVLAVLGFHAFPGKVALGYYGVDVFFVISGYLITELLLRENAGGRIDLRRFYARRIRRLMPALLVVLAACVAAAFLLMRSLEFQRFERHVVASLAFVQNFNLAGETGYFDTDARAKPLLHLWSLSVEEQFYLAWPALLLLFGRSRRAVGILLAVAVAASFAFALSGVLAPERDFYSPLTRIWDLGLGAGLAWWRAGGRGLGPADPGRVRDALSIAALALMLVSFRSLPIALPHPGVPTLLPVLATLGLIATGSGALANRLIAWRPVVWVGLISYPLYLWHWPLLAFPYLILGEPAPAWARIAALCASLLLAWATARWIEGPLRYRWPVRRAVWALVGGAVALALLMPAIVALHQWTRGPREAMIERELAGTFWRFTRNDICEARYGTDYHYFCIQNRPGEPTLLLLGNSFANHLYAGFAGNPATRGETILSYGTCDASGIYPGATEDCPRQDAVIARSPSLRTVIVSSAWPRFDDEGWMVDLQTGSRSGYESFPRIERYEAALTARLRAIAARGIRIVILGPKPDLGYDIGLCYSRPLRPAARDCVIPRAQADSELHNGQAMLRRVAAAVPGAALFDQQPIFCDAQLCRYRTADGLPLLRDTGHYSEYGSAIAVDRMLHDVEINRPATR